MVAMPAGELAASTTFFTVGWFRILSLSALPSLVSSAASPTLPAASTYFSFSSLGAGPPFGSSRCTGLAERDVAAGPVDPIRRQAENDQPDTLPPRATTSAARSASRSDASPRSDRRRLGAGGCCRDGPAFVGAGTRAWTGPLMGCPPVRARSS